MSQTNDLTPPIDSTVEEEAVGFDFGPILLPGASVQAVTSLTCAAAFVAFQASIDPTPASRILSSPSIITSKATGAANAAVSFLVGNMVAGTTYRLQCVVQTSDGQELSLWTHLACIDPS